MAGGGSGAELAGWWWLPDQPDDKIPGVLRCAPGQHPRLLLIGGFDPLIWVRSSPNSWEASGEMRTWPLLLGESDGQQATLLDCCPSSSSRSLQNRSQSLFDQTLIAMRALIGVHLESADQATFKAMEINIENLLAWSAAKGLRERVIDFQDAREREADIISAEFPEERSALIDDYRITLHHRLVPGSDCTRSDTTATITENAVLSVEPLQGLRSLAGLTKLVKPLQDLITLATNRPAAVLSTELVAPSADHASDAGDEPPRQDHTVQVYNKHIVDAEPGAAAIRPSELLFSLDDIGFDKVVPTWFGLRGQLSPASNMLFGLHYIQDGYLEDRLVMAVSAAEALHRRLPFDPPMSDDEFKFLRDKASAAVPAERGQWVRERLRNESTLKERLLDLASLPDSEVVDALMPDRGRWATLAKNARNALVHRTPKKDHSLSIDETYAVVEVTRALLTLVLIGQAGLPFTVQQRIVRQSPEFQQVSRMALKHLSAS